MSKILVFISIIFSLQVFANELPQARAVVESINRTVLSSEIGGKITYLNKKDGDSFKKGETLLKIECGVYIAERDKIGVKAGLARTKLKKNKQLSQYNSVGKFDVEISKLELREQQLAYKIANINVKRCQIKAPFTGRVVKKFANKYQNVKPQQELLEVINTDSLEIKSVVPANWLRWLKVGQEIVFKVDEVEEEIKTEVLQIDSVVDPKSQTINLRAEINDSKNIISGMSGTVYFTPNKNEKKVGYQND